MLNRGSRDCLSSSVREMSNAERALRMMTVIFLTRTCPASLACAHRNESRNQDGEHHRPNKGR